ncbi:MAG: hypothetical protein AB7U82_01055 [Blastocatellales bacterium]
MEMTLKDLDDAINGLVTYTRGKGGPVIPLKLTKSEKAVFQQVIKQGYAVAGDFSSLRAAHSKWCDITKKPDVVVKHKAKYAFIGVDMILTGQRLSPEAVASVEGVFKKYAVVKDSRSATMHIHLGGTYSYCDRIPKETAEQAAKELVEIAFNESNWTSELQTR